MKLRFSARGPALGVVLATCLAVGCGAREAAQEGWAEHPRFLSLAAFSDFEGGSLELAGAPERRWIRHQDREVPAVVGGASFGLGLRLPELSGAAVSAGYGYLDGEAEEAAAVFQVIAVPSSGESVVLFQDRPAADRGRWHTMSSAVKGKASGPGWLRLEVVYLDDGEGRARKTGAWIDPVVEVVEKHQVHPVEKPWNLILITADTTRPDFLGLYGGPARTPALERLAEAGVVFLDAHTVATGTTPAHASLFTGLHSRQHGIYNNRSVLGEERVTLAEVLDNAGYSTAAFVAARPLARAVGLDQGFQWFDDVFGGDETGDLGRFAPHERRAERVVSRFQQWLGSEASEAPFVAWIHLFDPHQPYATRDYDPAGESPALTRWFEDENGPRLVYARSVGGQERASFEALNQAAQRRYTAEIEYLDSQLGRILDDLERRDLLDRSVVLFLSDHGENFGDRGEPAAFHHAGLHGDVTRLAMVLKLPGSRFGGTRQSALIPSSDVPCTLLDILGASRPESWSCRSFLELVRDPEATTQYREHLILEGPNEEEIAIRTSRYLLRALRDKVRADERFYGAAGFRPGQPAELYDLSGDSRETENVFDLQEYRPQVARLRQVLDDFLQSPIQEAPATVDDEEHLEGLKALGYLD